MPWSRMSAVWQAAARPLPSTSKRPIMPECGWRIDFDSAAHDADKAAPEITRGDRIAGSAGVECLWR